RFASVITILILLATLLLLGFSIYLASELGFINFGSGQQEQPTPTMTATTVSQVNVPDLKGMTLQQAQDALQKVNLKLGTHKGPDDGVIVKQSASAGSSIQGGSTITVETQTPKKVPDNLVNDTVANAEQALKAANIPYVVSDDGFNANYGPNT